MNDTENKPARHAPHSEAGGREYEMAYFLTSEIAGENTGVETEEIVKILSENGGESVQSNPLQIKRLAYPIKKQNQAYFGTVFFLSDNEGLEKIKKALVFNKKILRYLIVNNPLKPIIVAPAASLAPSKTPIQQSFDQKLESILKS